MVTVIVTIINIVYTMPMPTPPISIKLCLALPTSEVTYSFVCTYFFTWRNALMIGPYVKVESLGLHMGACLNYFLLILKMV